MRCTNCGNEVEEHSSFCPYCGTEIKRESLTESNPVQKKNYTLWFMVGGIAFVVWLVAVIAIIVVIVRGKGNEKEEVTALEEENGVTTTLDFREVINNESLANVRVCFYEGYDNVDGDAIAEYETPDNGEILAQIPEGDYTVSWESDGYYGGYENITVNEDGGRMVKRMLPVLTGQKAYILLEWDSDKDLDLCVYNAQIDQYIDTQSGVDTTGSFLYSDNAGEEGYELICLGDYTTGIYTIYVKDGECLRNGTDSTMETDNLRVSIYTAEGLAYRETAASSESAALWNPVYLHDGTAEGLENYIYDLAQYAWATQDKNDDSYARNKEALAAYQEFLRGELPTKEGKYLLDFLADYEDGVDWDGYVDEIDYAYLDLGNDKIQELLVTFVGMDFYCADDVSTDEYILKYDEDGLRVCYEFQTWARSDTEVSYYGIVKGSGSNGATSHAKDGAVLDGEGSLIPVYSSEIEGDLSIGYMEPFHQDGVNMAVVAAALPDVELSSYEIGNQYYLAYDETDYNTMSFAEVSSILSSRFGYQLYTTNQINDKIDEYAESIGLDVWSLKDVPELKTEVLDKQYYGIYAKPDTLEFTTEEQEFLAKVAYGIYVYLDTNGYTSLDYTAGQIQDGIGVEEFLWDVYYGTGKYLGEIDYYSRYQISASEAETMLKELIGREYDLASLLRDSSDWENGETGTYYTNGDIITYMALIGYEEGPMFEKLYEEDGEWKFCVAVYSFDEIVGRIELTLRPMRNSYGCQITGCHIDSYQ